MVVQGEDVMKKCMNDAYMKQAQGAKMKPEKTDAKKHEKMEQKKSK